MSNKTLWKKKEKFIRRKFRIQLGVPRGHYPRQALDSLTINLYLQYGTHDQVMLKTLL